MCSANAIGLFTHIFGKTGLYNLFFIYDYRKKSHAVNFSALITSKYDYRMLDDVENDEKYCT